MTRYSRILCAPLPLAIFALAAAPPAHAQTTAVAPASDGNDAAGGGDIVVTGTYAHSLAAATETKRKADYGVDAINSTDIGKFPTQNVAEALQLVTGVAITRPRGEGLYVSVRGLGPQFQSTLVNGRTVAINDLIENGGANGRQFRFEMLPAEFVSQIDVIKTPTADMTEGALGGNIDVKTFRPLDVGNKTTLNLRGTYTSMTGKVRPNATLLTSVKTDDDHYTITIDVAGFTRDDLDITFQSNLLSVSGRKQEAPPQTYLHRGIAARPFEHRFELADHVRVIGADLSNGLLTIDLVREIPEDMKPRKIAIQSTSALEQPATVAQIDTHKAA